VVAVRWVSFGTAVPSWSSSLVVARHLPHGRSPGGDRHLNFYRNPDNLADDERGAKHMLAIHFHTVVGLDAAGP
jgi:hypothetical protein